MEIQFGGEGEILKYIMEIQVFHPIPSTYKVDLRNLDLRFSCWKIVFSKKKEGGMMLHQPGTFICQKLPLNFCLPNAKRRVESLPSINFQGRFRSFRDGISQKQRLHGEMTHLACNIK